MKKIMLMLLLIGMMGMSSCSLQMESETTSPESSSEYQESDSSFDSSISKSSSESEGPATEPNISASGAVQPVSILPIVSAEAKPVALTITASNPIASEMTVITDGEKAAEFASKLQQAIPTEWTLPEDMEPVDIVLRYSFDGGEHDYRYYWENGADYIAVDGKLYRVSSGSDPWFSDLIPKLPAVPAGITEEQIRGQAHAVIRKVSLTGASERVIWQPDQLEQMRNWIEDAEQVGADLMPDTGGTAIEVTFLNSEDSGPYTWISQQENGVGLMKQGTNWYYVDEAAYMDLSKLFCHDA